MVLCDMDIHYQLRHGRIVIDPLWDCALQIQPCSVDLRLGNEFKIFPLHFFDGQRVPSPVLDPLEQNAADLMESVRIEEGEGFILHPNHFALACTVERLKIPADILGRVDGRSSIGRLGILIHATAGLIDPGFEGYLTLELGNIGPYPVVLHPGMRICQISFEMLSQKCSRPYGSRQGSKYQDQTGATASRICQDTDSRK
jgi:dCTP deaminase